MLTKRENSLLFNGMMKKLLRSSGSRRTCGALLLMAVIGAWLPTYSLLASRIFAFARDSRAADEPASIEQRIDQEVHEINTQLAEGRAFTLQPNYEFEWYNFVTAFEDTNGHIRKIIDWAEGAREGGGVAGIRPGPFTLRSIWEWYYDTKGDPIFLMGRYEGEPGSGTMQENIYYIQNVEGIERRADNYIRPYFYQSETNKDLLSSGRDELQTVSKKLSEQGYRKNSP